MSLQSRVVNRFFITCDAEGCGKAHDDDFKSASAARYSAEWPWRWHVGDDGKAYCPEHREAAGFPEVRCVHGRNKRACFKCM